jgi:dipeptidase D
MAGLEKLKPTLVWNHFDQIRQIPRCSKHEEKIRKYILDFAKRQGLQSRTDKVGNVVVVKPAAKGMEKKPIAILQGHMDMVCEKNSDVTFDFSKDPIQITISKDIVKAKGTTLGGDNGIGLAMSLAILEDKTLKLGPIEALFTVDEETGLTGAFALEAEMLKGRIMLNLDSEDFGVLTVGCAGGGDSKLELPLTIEPTPKDMVGLSVTVSGLRGGHSGVDIHEQRGNAVKILARLLWKAGMKHTVAIADIKGGDKHNAIPREAHAVIGVPKAEKATVIALLKQECQAVLEEVRSVDAGLKLVVTEQKLPAQAITRSSSLTLLNLLCGLPHGVDKRSYDIPTLVETSNNVATVSIMGKTAVISTSSRSSVKSELQDMRDRIHAVADLAGARVTEGTPYPGWKPNMGSKLLKLSTKVFKDMYKMEPKIEAIHAGLETGIIGEKFPGMDMISIGPTLKNPHSPDEYLVISTVGKTYDYVLKILQNL